MRNWNATAPAGQPIQGIDFGVLPFRFLHSAAVTAAPPERARIAAAARPAPFLVSRELVKAALLRLFIDFGAPVLVTADHDVYRCLLAALQAAQDRVDHAVVDERLQPLGDFHRAW